MAHDRRALGRSHRTVSALTLAGSFGISADDTVRAFHELGVRSFFVTSRARGIIEGVRRLIADGHRDQLTVVCGAAIPFGFSVGFEQRRMAKALGTDKLDVFLLYWVQAHWYVTGNTWKAMRRLKDENLVASLGISCHDRPMARSLIDELELDVVMLRYNAAHRGVEREVFDTLDASSRPGIIAYTATRWGKLLKPFGDHAPMSAGECYRFVLGHPLVDTVLCGARSFEELASNQAAVALGPLEAPRLQEIKQLGDAVRSGVASRVAFAGG
ncbi:MAG: aldo/keto reductase [Polyangiaceae bacterium]|nr:aldo/keto reductase [Polyangiaceae bacterium]